MRMSDSELLLSSEKRILDRINDLEIKIYELEKKMQVMYEDIKTDIITFS